MVAQDLYPPGLEIRSVSQEFDDGIFTLIIGGPTEICLIDWRRRRFYESIVKLSTELDISALLEGEWSILVNGHSSEKPREYLFKGDVCTFIPKSARSEVSK